MPQSTSITWERTASRSETGLLIPSGFIKNELNFANACAKIAKMQRTKSATVLALALLFAPVFCQNLRRTSTVPVSGFEDYGTVGYPLRGCVIYASTLNPVSGITVGVFMGDGARVATAKTDEKGCFSFPNLSEGAYSVEGTADHIYKIQGVFRINKSSKSLLILTARSSH